MDKQHYFEYCYIANQVKYATLNENKSRQMLNSISLNVIIKQMSKNRLLQM